MPAQILRLKSSIAPKQLRVSYNTITVDGSAFEASSCVTNVNTFQSTSSALLAKGFSCSSIITPPSFIFMGSTSSGDFKLPLNCTVTAKAF